MSDIIRRFSGPPGTIWRRTYLGSHEPAFRDWYSNHAQTLGIDPNPDAPEHKYDYRAAWAAGAEPSPADDGYYHWPSRFKLPDHPNRYVDGVDTLR